MPLFDEIFNRLRYLAVRTRVDGDADEEIRLHIEERAAELEQAGVPAADAQARARREFGNLAHSGEASRSAWQITWLENLCADARYAVRSFRRNPGFAATAVACLALGIGANDLVFSIASEVLFSAPSVRDPKTLIHVRLGGNSHLALREYRFVRDSGVFAGLAGENEDAEVNWRHGDVSERLFAMRVTDNFFEVTGTQVGRGRAIVPGDANAVVISYRLWQTRFGADPDIAGRKMILDGMPYTVAGVLPRDHRTVIGFGFAPDVYVPLANDRDPKMIVALYGRERRPIGRGELLGRLRAVAEDLDRTYPDPNVKWSRDITAAPLSGIDRLRGEKEMATMAIFFAVLLAVTGLVLFIACANVASLLLARAASRSHEFAIRLSIGAGRARIVRQLLVESFLLAACGAAAAAGFDAAGASLLGRIRLPLPIPIQFVFEPDWRLLTYSAAISIAAALTAGAAPALACVRSGIATALKFDDRQMGAGHSRFRNGLVAAQLAVSVILLAAGFVFLRNLMESASMRPGFDAGRTVWAFMRLVPDAYPNAARVNAIAGRALETLRALPGVESATITRVVPLNDNMHITTELSTDKTRQPVHAAFHSNYVGEDYFRTMGIQLLSGREFHASDRGVAILNRNMAALLFREGNPIGHTVRFGDGTELRVLGVVENSKYLTLGEAAPLAMYEPYGASSRELANLHFLVRTRLDPASLVPAINRALSALDPTAALETKPMSRALVFAMLPSRVGAALLGSIGLLGLALASIGLYGALAYAVSRRIREIGLRVALGAAPMSVLALVMRQSAWLVGIGLCAGLAIAALIVRPLAMFLVPEVRPQDPVNFLAVAGILFAVGVVATAAPALRALRVDPLTALRHE